MDTLTPADRGSPVLALNQNSNLALWREGVRFLKKVRNLEEQSYIVFGHGYMMEEKHENMSEKSG